MVFHKVLFLDQNFIIYVYINDLCNVSTILKCILFADDAVIICSKYYFNELCTQVTCESKKVNYWYNINKLSLNLDKATFMLFTKSRSSWNVSITIKNLHIARVYITNILGIILTKTWHQNITYLMC